MKEYYLVTGRYDAVVISEAPDDETIAKLHLSIAPQEQFVPKLLVHIRKLIIVK